MDKLKNRIQENIHEMNVDEPNTAAWESIKSLLGNPAESDLLKNHIATNKSKLEIEFPGTQSWEEISNSITTKKRAYIRHIKRRIVYLSAACIVIMTGLAVLRYTNIAPINQDKVVKKISLENNDKKEDTRATEPDKNQPVVAQPLPDLTFKQETKSGSQVTASAKPVKKQKKQALPPEVLQIAKDYDQLIAGQIAYTKSLALYGESASYFEEFMNDFKRLEFQEQELQKSIIQNGLRENSIDDLAIIYQQKLTVLKKLQNEINKTSNRNKNLTDTIPTYINL